METTLLKNNTEVFDIRLGRIEQFDERSLNFPLTSVLKSGIKRNRLWRCNENYNQKSTSACVAYSIAHELAATPVEILGLTDDYIFNQIYCEAQKIDPWPGSECGNNPPKYGGTSVLAGIKIAQALGYFSSYKWAFGINDLLLGLSSAGPAVLGIKWFRDMSFPDNNGFIKPTGQLDGGHAILARGVNWNDKYVTLRNSWGNLWGKNGDCYISFDNLDKLLKDNGEAVFFIGRKNPNKLIPK